MAAGGWRLVDGWEAVGAVLWVQGETAARRCCCTRLPRREHGAALRATSCAVRAVPMAMVMGQQLLGHRRRQQVRRTTHRSMAQPAVPSRQRLNGNVAPRLGAPMARDPSVSSSSLSRAVHVSCAAWQLTHARAPALPSAMGAKDHVLPTSARGTRAKKGEAAPGGDRDGACAASSALANACKVTGVPKHT